MDREHGPTRPCLTLRAQVSHHHHAYGPTTEHGWPLYILSSRLRLEVSPDTEGERLQRHVLDGRVGRAWAGSPLPIDLCHSDAFVSRQAFPRRLYQVH